MKTSLKYVMKDTESLEVVFPDGPGRNAVVTFIDMSGALIEVHLPASAVSDMREALAGDAK